MLVFYPKSTGRVTSRQLWFQDCPYFQRIYACRVLWPGCTGTHILKPKDLHVQVVLNHKAASLLTLTFFSSMKMKELCESLWPILTVICPTCKCTRISDDELHTFAALRLKRKEKHTVIIEPFTNCTLFW